MRRSNTLLLFVALVAAGCASGPTAQEIPAPEKVQREAAAQQAATEQARQAAEKQRIDGILALEQAGVAAEAAGKRQAALDQYTAAVRALSGPPWDIYGRITERAIKLSTSMNPPPAIPEEAKQHLGMGVAAAKVAQNAQGYQAAADEFFRATNSAPWWPSAHFNLALVHEKMGIYGGAEWNLKMFLLGSPHDPEATSVQAKIYELDFKMQHPDALGLSGRWVMSGNRPYRVEAAGNHLRFFEIYANGTEALAIEGDMNGDTITGVVYFRGGGGASCGTVHDSGVNKYYYVCKYSDRYPMTGKVTDANHMSASFDWPVVTYDTSGEPFCLGGCYYTWTEQRRDHLTTVFAR